ncbi:pentapeptide repeat-containing protein [Cohnella panacarvi]|uniref:pentapeptide repeat-containing protein n=1 Tax=Cohnella panacarvi TaxID=400776 RepID=UPI00047A849B|nr:pentapeptide repeat-containing protein [Cohnella panacarvi]
MRLRVENDRKILEVVKSNVDGSSISCSNVEGIKFDDANLARASFNNVNLTKAAITGANISELVIDRAQWGGARLSNIGFHNPADPSSESHPESVTFTNCSFKGGVLSGCNLANVKLEGCEITGLTIDGVNIEDLLKRYRALNE